MHILFCSVRNFRTKHTCSVVKYVRPEVLPMVSTLFFGMTNYALQSYINVDYILHERICVS